METAEETQSAAAHAPDSPEVPIKKTRTRSGCMNCRRRRRKCDELRPSCLNCRQRGEECEWGVKLNFRPDNASTLGAEHPSMREGSRKRPRHYKIMDMTSQVEKDYTVPVLHAESPTSSRQDDSQSATSSSNVNSGFEPINDQQRRYSQNMQRCSEDSSSVWQAESPSFYTPNSTTASHSDGISFSVDDSHPSPASNASHMHLINSQQSHHPDYFDRAGASPQFISEQRRRLSNNQAGRSPIHTEDAAAELLALRYMPSQLVQTHSSPMDTVPSMQEHSEMPPPIFQDNIEDQPVFDQQMFDDVDGIFLPGSAYHELHSTLRDHLIYTARSNAPTRNGSPELQSDLRLFTRGLQKHSEGIEESRESDPDSIHSSRPLEITPHREYVLWKTWIDEVSTWLDKFDNGRMFEHKMPLVAKSTPHLKYSMLALAARQIERKENSASSSESLALYQEAIHLLLPELQSKNTAVIASCVILCVLEMMSCSPRAWKRHLEGCANLLEAVGINGFVGGVEGALFWCFARMDVWGALISQDVTLIPAHRWASKINLIEDIKLFRNPSAGFDSYANFAVFLCANCVTLLQKLRTRVPGHEPGPGGSELRWTELFEHLEDWYNLRPEEMKPILTIPAAERHDQSPFPTVLYGNGPAVSGNQLYHTAALLMLQEKPSNIKLQKQQKSIFWHARQIVAISLSNTHHGAWTNSIQPIWIAGKVMSQPSEHRAILEIYEMIERETGWGTNWRREDLKNWWGDSDD